MRLITRLLRFFYHHIYHDLAFTYDAVAAAVSFGQWIKWTKTILPFIQGTRILELGHGPGHLQRILLDPSNSLKSGSDLFVVGLDESSQMGWLARRRLIRAGIVSPRLTRGLAQVLPFQADTFDSIVSSFPAEYIFDPGTLSEVYRVLCRGGRLIVLPAAWPRSLPLKWLYRITGESPAESAEAIKEKWIQPFLRAGFACRVEIVEVKSSILLLMIASKG
jgi:ubiquinone/menaquinone biosynthesis C-methylase UbiE